MTDYGRAVREEMEKIDRHIALSIAGFAGLPTRDRHGNISTDIWTIYNVESVAKLLDLDHMRRLMTEQMTNHLEARKSILLEAPDQSTVVNWIFEFSREWERAYRQDIEHWDIAQMILTIMEETVCEMKEVFDYTKDLKLDTTVERISNIIESRQTKERSEHDKLTYDVFKDGYAATIRFLFRNKYTGPMLIRIAGKKLQKQLVCNRSGAYSARVQRNDVTQEKDDAVTAFVDAALEGRTLFQECSKLIKQMENVAEHSSDDDAEDDDSDDEELDDEKPDHPLKWLCDHKIKNPSK